MVSDSIGKQRLASLEPLKLGEEVTVIRVGE
jgi:hypothetical protein